MSVTLKVYDPSGKAHEIEFASEEALLRVLLNPCVRKLRSGEPFFVLRGQDASAPALVEEWISRNTPTLETDKRDGALRIAEAMRTWPNRRAPT